MPSHHNHAARPVCQGIYALLHNEADRQTHLVYILTIPSEPEDLQREFGIRNKRGGYVVSVRNPETPPPRGGGVSVPGGRVEFTREMLDEFHGRRWMAARPEHLDVVNAQVLLIGERSGRVTNADGDGGAGGGGKAAEEDVVAREVLEELRLEDEERIRLLDGEHTIFKDLELSMEEYKDIKGSWDE